MNTAVTVKDLKKLLDDFPEEAVVLASINMGKPFAVFHGNATYEMESIESARACVRDRAESLTLDFYNSFSPPSRMPDPPRPTLSVMPSSLPKADMTVAELIDELRALNPALPVYVQKPVGDGEELVNGDPDFSLMCVVHVSPPVGDDYVVLVPTDTTA